VPTSVRRSDVLFVVHDDSSDDIVLVLETQRYLTELMKNLGPPGSTLNYGGPAGAR
jgi:hypothetical protein